MPGKLKQATLKKFGFTRSIQHRGEDVNVCLQFQKVAYQFEASGLLSNLLNFLPNLRPGPLATGWHIKTNECTSRKFNRRIFGLFAKVYSAKYLKKGNSRKFMPGKKSQFLVRES